MFKKPLNSLKTSTPLRGSDRKKLKQRVISTFDLSPEDGDVLVPDGIESLKFSTHLEEPGVLYLSREREPLWFTVGKGSEDLIPTIYTLWKKSDLLPFISTPAAVIPVLTGGADLMIPGVVHHTPSLPEGSLVSIRKYSSKNGKPQLSVPLAVGRLAIPSDQLNSCREEKGKAVLIAQVWKDFLWEMGSKPEVPDDKAVQIGGNVDESSQGESSSDRRVLEQQDGEAILPPPSEIDTEEQGVFPSRAVSYTPQEVTDLLHKSLLQAISGPLSTAPPSSYPIPATLFYTNYILPSRPAFPASVLLPSAAGSNEEDNVDVAPQEINIKTSSHKSLTTFLKAAEKLSLITLKQPQKHSQQTDLLIMAVNVKHGLVEGHKAFPTIQDIEAKAAKKAAQGKTVQNSLELEIREFWKPHLTTVDLFKGLGGSPSSLYTSQEVRSLVFEYVAAQDLVNNSDKSYVNLDELLQESLKVKGGGKLKGKQPQDSLKTSSDFMKRDNLVKSVMEKMQNWYEIQEPGKDTVQTKGQLKPIQVEIKMRLGRKATTIITGYEPFLVVEAEEMAEYLRKTCAGATSVSPASLGKTGMEVMVQGKQGPAVVEYLARKGIPKQWIEVVDMSGKKK